MDRVTAQFGALVVRVARHFIEALGSLPSARRLEWLVCFNKVYRGVRQWPDYRAHNPEDGGSNPSPATILKLSGTGSARTAKAHS